MKPFLSRYLSLRPLSPAWEVVFAFPFTTRGGDTMGQSHPADYSPWSISSEWVQSPHLTRSS